VRTLSLTILFFSVFTLLSGVATNVWQLAVFRLLAGVGIVVIYVVVSAGTPFGFPDFPAWPAAIESARPALGRGLVALIAAPILTATAAWMAGRRSVEIYPGRAKTAVKQPRFPA